MKINCTQQIGIQVLLRDRFDFTKMLLPSCTHRLHNVTVRGLRLKLSVFSIISRQLQYYRKKQFNNDKISHNLPQSFAVCYNSFSITSPEMIFFLAFRSYFVFDFIAQLEERQVSCPCLCCEMCSHCRLRHKSWVHWRRPKYFSQYTIINCVISCCQD